MSAEFFAYQDACVEVVDSILAGAVELTPALFNKAELEARFEAEALAAESDAQAEAEEFSR